MTYRTPQIDRGIRFIKDVTIYPEQMRTGFYYNPRKMLYERAKFPLCYTGRFDAQILKPGFVTPHHRWDVPIYFRVYELSLRLCSHAWEWEKMQALSKKLTPRGQGFFEPWVPFLIYEAHRKGVIDVLTTEEEACNTFYVRHDLAIHAVDIEMGQEDWDIDARGMGESQFYPSLQRIFIAR